MDESYLLGPPAAAEDRLVPEVFNVDRVDDLRVAKVHARIHSSLAPPALVQVQAQAQGHSRAHPWQQRYNLLSRVWQKKQSRKKQRKLSHGFLSDHLPSKAGASVFLFFFFRDMWS